MASRSPGRRFAPAVIAAVLLAAVAAPASRGAVPPPKLSAQAAIAVETTTGDISYARAARRRRPIASATKLMTALVALERLGLDRKVTVPAYRAGAAESLAGLRAGERISVADLLVGLLLPSGNDAAAAIAAGVAGSQRAFVAAMNRRARSLRLRDTHFANPIGLDDPRNYSSAFDLARLALVLERRSFFRRAVAKTRAQIRSGSRSIVVRNRNTLVATKLVDGIKTGHTRGAGYVLIGSGGERGVRVVSVVLGTPSESARNADTSALLRWALRRYRRTVLLPRGRVLATAVVRGGDGGEVQLAAGRTAAGVVRRDARMRLDVTAPTDIEGPLARGTRVGWVSVWSGKRRVARIPLVTVQEVEQAGTGERLEAWLGSASTLGLLAVLVASSLLLAKLRGRARRRRMQTRARAAA